MTPDDNSWDDERWAALLASTAGEGPPPDPEFLARLRERSAEVFAAQADEPPQPKRRRSPMLVLAWRALAASAAAAVLAAVWFLAPASRGDAAIGFGKVLENLAAAKTLHLTVTLADKKADVWATKPNRLRWDNADGTYKIALGSRQWLIDEKANRAAAQACSYFGVKGAGLSALALLGLAEPKDRETLLAGRPVERVKRGTVECDLYRILVPFDDCKIQLEAEVDAGTQLLRWLEAKEDRDGKWEPRAKLTVVAVDEPVREELFVVGDTLTEDGRIGKVTDAQGIVSIKPVMANRWTPVGDGLLLRPGDWLQTDIRGANAVAVRLVKQTAVTLGPGSLVELVKPAQIRIFSGDVKVAAGDQATVEVLGPGQQKVEVKGTQVFRVEKEKLVALKQEPQWLTSFEGRAVNESIGSLVANVEGRNVPLTVGYHKVTVDIRDQIARTVIEESFVNHTKSRLEGTFFFPLPQDASISGFGMWIGNQLVEADVVEKQRAREIYEEILRANRDPGLLEWSGGNLFKARVFPIEAESEKRIKITYTQVLPRKGNCYRYSYGLQSEMLKQHPLRELGIDVKLNSVAPLASVTSPTHTARIDQTRHSAHVEFTAQEYTPTRDFEVVVEVVGRQSDVVLIPHRRGDDGYFMLMVTPPESRGVSPESRGVSPRDASASDYQRDILPDGEPLDLLVLADTSASLDAGQRAAQFEFIAALLGALTPKDVINLAGCDVDCDWVFDKSLPAEAKNVGAIRQFLADRVSLGWTDLDKAFASALQRCGPKTRVVYVGDGIPTTGDADPADFTKRLRRLYEGNKKGTFYAVSVGSTFESGVLKAIASLGGGSVRQISGEHGPRAVALELLGEFARPAVRDLKVEFRGLRTARVYPAELPNIPAGSQQILLGRYLPEGRDQQGEVVVTGVQGDQPVRLSAQVSLKDAEQGNSFIPRLWARMHLDSLLQQGASQAIRDEIIALSEEYHIITPYTSLLVLESDADRERFKVTRRFLMRDAEKMFAEGRDNANFELMQQQMKRAGTWRLGLRRSALVQLSALGRDPQLFQPRDYYGRRLHHSVDAYFSNGLDMGGGGGWGDMNGPVDFLIAGNGRLLLGGGGDVLWAGEPRMKGEPDLFKGDGDSDLKSPPPGEPTPMEGGEESLTLNNLKDLRSDSESPVLESLARNEEYAGETDKRASLTPVRLTDMDFSARDSYGGENEWSYRGHAKASAGKYKWGLGYALKARPDFRWPGGPAYGSAPQYTQWLDVLFPPLPSAPSVGKAMLPLPYKAVVKTPKSPWSAEARALAQSLIRREQLAHLKEALEIDQQSESFDVRAGELSARSRSLMLLAANAWLVRNESDNSQALVQWCDGQQRGAMNVAYQLGRLRASVDSDVRHRPISLSGNLLSALDETYSQYTVELRAQGDKLTLMVLKQPKNVAYEMHVLVDTGRHAILSIEHRSEGKVTAAEKHADFVEVAGAWWPGRIEGSDDKGRRTGVATLKFRSLQADAFQQQWQQQLAGKDKVQFLRDPAITVADAKRAAASGKATFDDHVTLLMHFARSQQWTRVMEQLDEAERIAAGRPGMRWVRNAVLHAGRRHEELRKRIIVEGEELAKTAPSPQPSPEGRGDDSRNLFLANALLNQCSGILEANETLKLLDALLPLYQRQPAHLHAVKSWQQRRIDCLYQTGQTQEVLRLWKQLAGEYPRDYSLQQQYAQALANAGEYEAAYAWLKAAINGKVEWLPYEVDSLRSTLTQMMESQGRYADLLDFIVDCVKRNPEGTSAYQQYLSALIRMDRVDEANKLMAAWLKEAEMPGRLPQPVASRLEAAVSQALGQGHNMYTNRIDERWLRPLADATLFFARHPSQSSTADRIMNQGHFQQSDECRRVRKAALGILAAEIEKLPVEELQRFVNWIMPNDPAVEVDVWKRIAAGLRKRWSDESDPEVKHRLAGPLAQVLSSRLSAAELLDFLRVQLAQGPEEQRPNYAQQLFDALLNQPWSAGGEDEALALLEKLGNPADPWQKLGAQVAAVYRLTDRMVAARFDDKMKAIAHPEELSRIELKAKRAENMRSAREGLADRLAREIAKQPDPLKPWLNVERLYLDTLLGRNLKKVEGECWELLGPQPQKSPAEYDPGYVFQEVLRSRSLLTLCNLAARKEAEPALVDRLLKHLDDAAALDAEDARWRLMKFEMLVALDRPKDLDRVLRDWVRGDDPDNRWRLALGYLMAEQGKIPEAIKLFEAVAAADELGPAEYRALADWYMVVNRRQEHDRASISVFKTMQEYQMHNWLSAKLRPWQQSDGKLPSELDKDVLLVFAALFEKSGSPQQYLWVLQSFYQATRDFRLLSGLTDAVVGHTAGKVYPFLQGMSPVLSEVRDEATADSIVERIAEVRKRAKTDVDQRALDLLEVLVERRAAELINQPGPHADKALAAMQRAFKRQWSAGEKRLMADLLAHLGAISQPKLAKEQLRQLQTLHQEEAKGSFDRLHIALRWANALWSYSRRDEAIDLLEASLDEYQDAQRGVLPVGANEALTTFVGYLEQTKHHDRGEKVLFDQLKHPVNGQQKFWLIQRLYELYESAIRLGGDTSLGGGATLYQAVNRKIQTDLDTPDNNHRYALIGRLCGIYRAANEKKLAGVADDLRAFAFKRLPEVLKRQTNNRESIVSQVANTLHDVAGPRDGLAFLIEQIEHEPAWLRYNNQDGWSRHAWTLGEWRVQVKQLGDLEPRLLRIVLGELRRDLESRQSRNRDTYWRRHQHFWAEKEADFAKTADEVWAERKQSGAAVAYVAEYLFRGLEHYDRAIEMLFVALKDKVLDESGQSQLVVYLQERTRYGESIGVLLPLVELRPDNLDYRVRLMHAYFRTNRKDELRGLLEQTDAHFHKDGRWNESAMAALGHSCLENELFEQSVKYYNEAIPLHQRTQPNRGIGNGTLSTYYADLARAHAGLKNTAKAVDAACGAIVSWGPRNANRANALESLRQVLRQATDLDQYIAELNRESEKNRHDSPLVRKALGQVFAEKKEYAKAIAQLKLAVELQPNDAETHRALIDCYRSSGDREGVVRQTLQALQLLRREINLYKDLGEWLAGLEQAKEAERAYTSIVEVLSSESESHTLLAEIRQRQNRWSEATLEWQQVARIRELEPTGLLGLAAAQIHAKQWEAAADTLQKLRSRTWPPRFNQVSDQIRNLQRQLETDRK